MSYMLNEICEQPDVVARLVEEERKNAAALAADIKRRNINNIIMVARGTSDHAAIYGKYLFEVHNALPVGLADCSVFTLYDAKLKLDNALVIGISQSGEAVDVSEYLQKSRQMGALTAAITNEPGSKLTQVAEHTLLCHAGKEQGVAATKTYTSTLAIQYLLSAEMSDEEERANKLQQAADAMRAAIGMEDLMAEKAERYRYMQEGYVISRGFNYCSALEAALKLAETNYLGMKGFSAADFLHGPIAAVHEAEPCFLIAPPGKAFGVMKEMAAKLKERNAETIILSSDDEILSLAKTPVKIPVVTEEELTPLYYIIPMQLLAYHLAVTKGYDPDRPRGLSKVTLTR